MMLSGADMLWRLMWAVALGGAVGFERGRGDHPAGLRTHILVALASASFMVVSSQFRYYQPYRPGEFPSLDPSRIASGVVMGLGFLGAGSILREGSGIRGLTTAAGLWVATALGLAAGAGMYVLAALTAGLALFALIVLRWIERQRSPRRRVRIDLDGIDLGASALISALKAVGIEAACTAIRHDLKARRTRIEMAVTLPIDADEDALSSRLGSIPGARRVEIGPSDGPKLRTPAREAGRRPRGAG